jgi:hypothetical protein
LYLIVALSHRRFSVLVLEVCVSPAAGKPRLFFSFWASVWLPLTVALNVGWILLNLQQIALLVFGIVFFAIIITGLVLNTIFLVRENSPQRSSTTHF